MRSGVRRPAAEGVAQPLAVPHGCLAPDPGQPRQCGIAEGLGSLVESIRAHGIIQPILARPHPDPAARAATPYMIVVGERRWAAAGRAGLETVPVVLLDRELSTGELLMLQIAENEGESRQELTLYDLARAVARAVEMEGVSQARFALRHRRSPGWLSQMLALAHAQGLLAEALRAGMLRGRLVAQTFGRLGEVEQRELMAQARRQGRPISLTAAEKLAERMERERQRREAAAGGPGGRGTGSAADAAAGVESDGAAGQMAVAAAGGVSGRAAVADGARTAEVATVPGGAATADGATVAGGAGPAGPAALTEAGGASTFRGNSGNTSSAAAPAAGARARSGDAIAAAEDAAGAPAVAPGARTPAVAARSAAAGLLAVAMPAAGAPTGAAAGAPTTGWVTAPAGRAAGEHSARPAPAVGPIAGADARSGAAIGAVEGAGAAERVRFDLSLAQVQKFVRILGLEPAATPRALVLQILAAL
jgi:ParB/RepB/Spo0J family partition protein